MSKQIHIRINENELEAVNKFAKENGKSVQDTVIEAIRQYIYPPRDNRKIEDARFTFIDLFAGIGGL